MISRSAPASAASAATSSMPGVSTTGSNSLGTVLVAGRKRVPRPAAGTTAVRGIGTRGRVIVHTLSPSGYPSPESGTMSSWTRGVPDEGRDAGGDPGGPPRRDTRHPRRGGRRALRPSARRRRRRANRVRLRPDQVRARLDRVVGHAVTARHPGAAARGPRTTPTANRCRCSGGAYDPAGLSPAPFGLREPQEPWLPADAMADATAVLVPALAVDRAGVRLGRGAGFYDRTLPLADPAARLVAVVRDDELVDEVPAEAHDVR